MQARKSLLHTTQRILDGSYDRCDLKTFIARCAYHSEGFLRNRISRGKLYFDPLLSPDRDVTDLAIDCIAGLFSRDTENQFYLLNRYFDPLWEEISSHPELLDIHLRRLIVSTTHQELIAHFAQSDPHGWRIYRNLNLVPKRLSEIKSHDELSESYFYYTEPGETIVFPENLCPECPTMKDDALYSEIARRMSGASYITGVIREFLRDLRQQDDVQQFVSKLRLFRAIRNYDSVTLVPISSDMSIADLSTISPESTLFPEIKDLLEQIKPILLDNIQETYTNRAKICEQTSQAYFEILKGYFTDFLQDGKPRKLPDYFRGTHLIHDSDQAYRRHRGRIEYLIKITKQDLRQSYAKHFPNQATVMLSSDKE